MIWPYLEIGIQALSIPIHPKSICKLDKEHTSSSNA